MSRSETMHLAADISFIHTDHLWRTAGSWVGYDYYGPDFYEDVARSAARGVFDMLFFGDAAETPELFGGNFPGRAAGAGRADGTLVSIRCRLLHHPR